MAGADPGVATIHIANLFQVNSPKYRKKSSYKFESGKDWVWYRTNVKEGTQERVNRERGYKEKSIADIVFRSSDKPSSANDFSEY